MLDHTGTKRLQALGRSFDVGDDGRIDPVGLGARWFGGTCSEVREINGASQREPGAREPEGARDRLAIRVRVPEKRRA